MKVKLFHEKFTIWHSNRGSIGFLIVVCAVILICILPIQIFFIRAMSDSMLIHKTKNILHDASINSFQAFSEKSLGSGIVRFDNTKAERIFRETAEEFFLDNPRLNKNKKLKPKFSYNGNSIVVECEVRILSFFGRFIKVKEKLEFIPEIP